VAARAALGSGVGALAALSVAWLAAWPQAALAEPGRPRVWLCDRDGGRVVGLDGDGLVANRRHVPWPLEAAATGLGDLWVLAAVRPGPSGARRLLCLRTDGEAIVELSFEWARGLRCDSAGAAILLAGEASGRELVRVEASGRRSTLMSAVGASHWLELRGGVLLVGGEGLTVHALGMPARPVTNSRSWPAGERCLEVATAPAGAWILTQEHGLRRLRRVGSDLNPLDYHEWRVSLADSLEARLVAQPLRAEVDVLAASGELRTFAVGGSQRERRWLPVGPIVAGAAGPAGELWYVTTGACLRLDPRGRPLPGQGGFERLVDVSIRQD
jgi:hypothetical protein